ncbi:hypothetical protein ACGF3C_11190 [Micromonospora sp. NPDC047762]|uniref:hypothetical protein n=1 Tax=Micromonospora sp. NPDC047762 TaxID=3364255 RepID=UPI003714B371
MIGDRWGVTRNETTRSYPCDDFVLSPALQAWRGVSVSYVLVPWERNTTRLLLKVVMQTPRWAAPGLSVGDLIMARRQLLNLKQLAERSRHR